MFISFIKILHVNSEPYKLFTFKEIPLLNIDDEKIKNTSDVNDGKAIVYYWAVGEAGLEQRIIWQD